MFGAPGLEICAGGKSPFLHLPFSVRKALNEIRTKGQQVRNEKTNPPDAGVLVGGQKDSAFSWESRGP